MLPIQRWRPRTYPPGPQFAQFGDDLLGHSVSLADEARAKLAEKRRGMSGFHMERLQNAGLLPGQSNIHHAFATHQFETHADPEQAFVDAFDRPQHLPHNGYETPSEATVSPPTSPRTNQQLAIDTPIPASPPGSPRESVLAPLGRVARAGFHVAAETGMQVAQYAGTSLKKNVAATASLAHTGLVTAGQIGHALGNSSARAASQQVRVVASHAHAAAQPGSNTRQALAETAHTLHETLGPPMVYGASAAAHAIGQGGAMTAKGVGHGAVIAGHGLKHVAIGTAHVVGHGLSKGGEMAARIFSAASISAMDILKALDEMHTHEMVPHASSHYAIGNGHQDAIGNGGSSRSRTDTPPKNRSRSKVHEPAKAKPTFEHNYSTADEWLEYVRNKGALVEELYKRPNWTTFIKHHNTPELRKKIGKMTPRDLAEIIVKLDHM